jgi:cytochrome c biogenesis protein CcdA
MTTFGRWLKAKFGKAKGEDSTEKEQELGEDSEGIVKEDLTESKHEQKYQRTLFVILILIIIAALVIASFAMYYPTKEKADPDIDRPQANIFYSFTCPGCADYIENELITNLTAAGFQNLTQKDYINDDSGRTEMSELDSTFEVPSELQGHITTYIFPNSTSNATIILKGHVPAHIIRGLLDPANQTLFNKIIVTQDEMVNPVSYKVWAFSGAIKEFPIDTPITEYLQLYAENKDGQAGPDEESLLGLVLVTGFLDGINPCAIAILLFFIAFLFTMRKTRASVFKMGVVYIAAIFLVYFLIGLGLLNAILLSNQPHFMAKVGAALVIILGSINLINYAFPQIPNILKTPKFSWEALKKWIYRSTLPSALVAGLLVGLCTFPCSGGIYVAVLGLLAAKTTYFGGLGYLYLYNFMFVLPLIFILLGVSNKPVAKRLAKWERSSSQSLRLFSGLVMIALGIIIIIWFI